MNLSSHIENDLARRIKSRAALPCLLKLQPLATHYHCSTRPVREALARLKVRGLLQPQKLASLPIESSITESHPPSPEAQAGGELFQTLTRQLIALSLRPHPTTGDVFVRETAIARKLGVSTTIVREHFNRLVGHGLLEHVPRRGWRLRPIHQKDLDDFIHVRLSLEFLALSIAWDRLDAGLIRGFLDLNVPPRQGRPAQADNQFHGYIIEVADNLYIRDFLDRQGRYFKLLFEWEDQDAAVRAQTVRQHRRLLQAILRRDLPAAQAALRVHILDNHPVLTTLLAGRKKHIKTSSGAM